MKFRALLIALIILQERVNYYHLFDKYVIFLYHLINV